MVAADTPAILSLNSDNPDSVFQLDETTLAWLLNFEGHHLVAVTPEGEILGYLVSIASNSTYDDAEVCDLRLRLGQPFLYICQVVIATGHRREGIGFALYDAVTQAARTNRVPFLGCDVNTQPPNAASFAFHRKLGFVEFGPGVASNGTPIVFLIKDLNNFGTC